MIRVEVSEVGQPALPALDLEPPFVIGSAIDARVRLPAAIAQPQHLRVESEAEIGEGKTLEVGSYRIALSRSPANATPTPPQRTESLARELMRNLLGTAGAPTLEIVRGPHAGAKRVVPPGGTLVIGRGDEASWCIEDDDLSRVHAEIRRASDGVVVRDLDSKNGTKLGGRAIDGEVLLADGAELALGNIVLRFRDPAAQRLQAEPRVLPAASPPVAPTSQRKASPLPFYAAIAIMLLALAGLVWIVST